jgi:hypothetical protein
MRITIYTGWEFQLDLIVVYLIKKHLGIYKIVLKDHSLGAFVCMLACSGRGALECI